MKKNQILSHCQDCGATSDDPTDPYWHGWNTPLYVVCPHQEVQYCVFNLLFNVFQAAAMFLGVPDTALTLDHEGEYLFRRSSESEQLSIIVAGPGQHSASRSILKNVMTSVNTA